MKDSFTQSMDWLHTWGGLLFGWLLFAIFLTGTLTVFDKEITYWMQPELHHLASSDVNIDAATNQLRRFGLNAKVWWIEFPFSRSPKATIFWQTRTGDEFEQRYLDPATGDVLRVRDTRGGEFFYRFHYQLHLDQPGVWIVGAAAMVMLVALVTGIVIHHRIFKDFFTFRPRASSHRSWLDAHNVTSVLVLPFHLVITFTGLVIFWTIYMPAGIQLFYGGNVEKAYDDIERHIERDPEHRPASLASLSELERRARAQWNGGVTEWIEVKHPGDRQAIVNVTRRADDRLALTSDRVTFDGASGDMLQVWTGDQPAYVTYSVLLGLHYLWFKHPTIRWLYFFMGLSASAMIATGLMLWVIKRRDNHIASSRSYRIVEALNVAVVAGLFVAVAVFFWSNRLMPVELTERALWEMRAFFIAWSVCAVHGFVRRDTRRAWKEQLLVAATMMALLPLLNMVTTDSHLLVTIPDLKWRLAAVDLTSVAAGALVYLTAWRIGRPIRETGHGSIHSLSDVEHS